MSNLAFDDLRWLNLLWAALAVALLGAWGVWQRRRALRLFASLRLLPRLTPGVSWVRGGVRLALVTCALLAIAAAAIGPRWGEREQRVGTRGIDVMILLDVSKSMLARDLRPNRLERAKLAIRDDLLPALAGDRVGLIAFAGNAVMKCPLTSDYGFFRLALDDATVNSVARGGTMIGDAIRMAGEALASDQLDTHKLIVLITDGEDHESFPVEAAANLWKDRQIPVVALALGDEREGARVPVGGDAGDAYLEYKGQTVWSKANFDQLRQVAAASDLNRFVPVGTKNFDLGEIYRTAVVPFVDFKERSETQRIPLPSQYHPFALAALALVLVDSLLRDAPRSRATGAAVGDAAVVKGAAA